MSEAYHDPVAQLLSLGDPRQEGRGVSDWLDYPALGLAAEHIPELARMLVDEELDRADSESAEVWAPVHAWRALGQLRAESVIEPLLQLLDHVDDDWAQTDVPEALGMIGPAAIPGISEFLADAERDVWGRIAVSRGLTNVAERSPETREQAVGIITDQLRRFAEQERVLNAYLVDRLCDLKAIESAALIEEAFAANMVDLSVLGDWEEAQILLGLLEKRVTPAPNFLAAEFGLPPLSSSPPTGQPAPHSPRKKRKAKRKRAKASRKRNRRR
jgi:hypothetical protein